MLKFNILLSKTAEKEFSKLEKQIQDKVRTELKELENNPFQSRPKTDIKKLRKMSKSQFYRLRVGNCRVVYIVENVYVKIIRIVLREKCYEWLD